MRIIAVEQFELRNQKLRLAKLQTREKFVHCRRDRRGRAESQSQMLRDESRRQRRTIAHGNDSIKRPPRADRAEGFRRMFKAHRNRAIRPRILEHMAAVRPKRQFHANSRGRLAKGPDLIPRGRSNKKNARQRPKAYQTRGRLSDGATGATGPT